MNNFSRRNRLRVGEVFANLATEVTNEVVFLEDIQDLNPDVRTLSNINPQSSTNQISSNNSNNQ
jgi:hypothetical protein